MAPRSVFVTGASRGLGLQFVKHILAQKSLPSILIAACRDPTKADELQSLAKTNDCLKLVTLDVTNDSNIEEAFAQTKTLVGDNGLNLLINNAGINDKSDGGFLEKQTREKMQRHFNTNVSGQSSVSPLSRPPSLPPPPIPPLCLSQFFLSQGLSLFLSPVSLSLSLSLSPPPPPPPSLSLSLLLCSFSFVCLFKPYKLQWYKTGSDHRLARMTLRLNKRTARLKTKVRLKKKNTCTDDRRWKKSANWKIKGNNWERRKTGHREKVDYTEWTKLKKKCKDRKRNEQIKLKTYCKVEEDQNR